MKRKSARIVQESKVTYSKTDTRYWLQKGKLRKDKKSIYYTVQIQFLGKRLSFPTKSTNKQVAARKAAEIYNDLVLHGVESAKVKHRPQVKIPDKVATVGEWINAVGRIFRKEKTTFTGYCRAIRKITGDIMKLKPDSTRFGPKKGGSTNYRSKTEAASLSILTQEAVHQWMQRYVDKQKSNTAKASAKTSCNSTIRQARSLFAPKITKRITHLILPEPKPFTGVEFYPRQNTKYRSLFDVSVLLKAATDELREKEPAVYLALVVAISTGLRRSEIDTLKWSQVDLENRKVWVELTDDNKPKTDDSAGSVDFDEDTATILKPFKEKAKSRVVLNSSTPQGGSKEWGRHYRAEKTWERLIAWLKTNGVKARNPIHTLRKEFGSLMLANFGIYAASDALRHSSVATTEAFYAHLKKKPVLAIGRLLEGKALSGEDQSKERQPSK
jgi:integrase